MPEGDEFDGCSRLCRKRGQHTLKWGECEHGVRPPPTLDFFRVVTMADGYPAGAYNPIPLTALLPWAASLTVDQQHQMLEEAAEVEDPAAVIARWKRKGGLAAPPQIQMGPVIQDPGPGFNPAEVAAAYERGRRQGRYEAGG
jgi:hypothetical protein